MPARISNITIEQGVDFARGWAVLVNGVAIDATWTAAAQIRADSTSATPLATFAADVDAQGNVVIALTPADSAGWTWREAVYDVQVVNADASLTLRVAEGKVKVDPAVTR